MKKSKILIQIFPMLKEIDYLERTLLLLKQSSLFIDKEKYHLILDVTLPTSAYLVDWEKSILKKDYFINRLKNFEKYYLGWCDEYSLTTDDNVKGVLDWFSNTINKYSDLDATIIIEPDVVFGPYTLGLYLESNLQAKNISPNYIITAEYIKMWDVSWDIVVNSTYLNEPFNFRNTNDAIIDTYHLKNNGNINLTPLIYNNQKYFKFGGGWFTLYSKHLIDTIDFPKELEGYGGFDNYVMNFCYNKPDLVTQYKIKNLVITDKHNHTEHYDNYICSLNQKQDLYEKNNKIIADHFKSKFGF
jgi:hypothetical protein